jgi:aldose sugar dehydrogenase
LNYPSTCFILKKHLLIVFVSLVLFACKQEGSDFSNPVAYLQLASTTIEISDAVVGLDVPWDVDASIPEELWFTEQKGLVHRLNLKTGLQKTLLNVPDVLFKKSYGLLGMAVHPTEPFVFLHYTFQSNVDDLVQTVKSKLVRYTIEGDTLLQPKILLDNIPGNTFHNGSRIVISPDNKLFLTLGDVGQTDKTQSDDVLAGKIMRLNLDGSIPADNPIPNSPIWSKGHRNPQGLTFGQDGTLYSSEHGPNNDDEVNIIAKNANYGWPNVQGFCDLGAEKDYCATHQITEPLIAWTPTIAVAGMGFYDNDQIPEWKNSLILANMKGRALRVLSLSPDGQQISKEHIYFQKYFGRLRDVSVAPNGDVYITTTNTDWHPRFQPWMYDGLPSGPDRILRLRSVKNTSMLDLPVLKEDDEAIDLLSENWNLPVGEEEFAGGQKLYIQNCLACHNPEGTGATDLYPPLAKSDWVNGDKSRLIRTMLLGLSEPIEVNGATYNQEMPAYAHLSDQEIAEILTYIKNSFGNQSGAVIAGEVYVERQSINK